MYPFLDVEDTNVLKSYMYTVHCPIALIRIISRPGLRIGLLLGHLELYFYTVYILYNTSSRLYLVAGDYAVDYEGGRK